MQKLSANSRNIISVTASVLLFCSLGMSLSGCATDSSLGAMTPAATGKSSPTKSADKKAIETNSPLPTPSGTRLAKLVFTCANVESLLALKGYSQDTAFVPENASVEARAIASGGSTCRWIEASGTTWISASIEKISPEDFRDFAESLGGFNSPANFGSTNASLQFYSYDGVVTAAKSLNMTYLLSVLSNKEIPEAVIGNYVSGIEQYLTSE